MRGSVICDGLMNLMQVYLKLSVGLKICVFIMEINHQWTFITQGTNSSETVTIRVGFS